MFRVEGKGQQAPPARRALSLLYRGSVSQQLSAVGSVKQVVSSQGMHILLIHYR